MNKITAIIPFYNENAGMLSVIKAVSYVEDINQIICIDDGSTNSTHKLVRDKFPQIVLIRLSKNLGKSQAVFEGIKKAKNEIIFLIDADLVGLSPIDLRNTINKFSADQSLDMVIMEVKGRNTLIDGILRKYIFQGGNRILKKNDLEKVSERQPVRYQLEVAINKYAIENNKKVKWIKCSAFNPHKSSKRSYLQGIIEDLRMDLQIISFLGFQGYLKQMLFFCREEVK